MLSISARNIDHAFNQIVDLFQYASCLINCPSRVGDVLMYPTPVCITYTDPWSNVLMNHDRDANVFFHLYEAMWMLAGRNDLASLQYYVSTFDNYSDDGMTLNGAYGHRWRHHGVRYQEFNGAPFTDRLGGAGVDQLKNLIEHLKEKPNSRRAVLQMWNVEDDLLKIESSKDVCCNLSVCFSIRENAYLDMTVFNRSNDAIWGTTGANAVHFSFLQQYVASHLQVEVGTYYQITNNLHVYKEIFFKSKKAWISGRSSATEKYPQHNPPLIHDPNVFEEELHVFVDRDFSYPFKEPFIVKIAVPLMKAFDCHRRRDYPSAFNELGEAEGTTWWVSANIWLSKREKLWQANTKN